MKYGTIGTCVLKKYYYDKWRSGKMKNNVIPLNGKREWILPEGEQFMMRDDRKQWGDDQPKVRQFCSNIRVNPEGKLYKTIKKNFLGRIQVGFENKLLVVKDESYKRMYRYAENKKALVLVKKEEVENSKKLPQLFGLRNRNFDAEMREIPIEELLPTMKMTVITQQKLKQTLEFIGHEWSLYDVQCAITALAVPTPFRLEWREDHTFWLMNEENQKILAQLTFPNKDTMECKQDEKVARYQIMSDYHDTTYLKKV